MDINNTYRYYNIYIYLIYTFICIRRYSGSINNILYTCGYGLVPCRVSLPSLRRFQAPIPPVGHTHAFRSPRAWWPVPVCLGWILAGRKGCFCMVSFLVIGTTWIQQSDVKNSDHKIHQLHIFSCQFDILRQLFAESLLYPPTGFNRIEVPIRFPSQLMKFHWVHQSKQRAFSLTCLVPSPKRTANAPWKWAESQKDVSVQYSNHPISRDQSISFRECNDHKGLNYRCVTTCVYLIPLVSDEPPAAGFLPSTVCIHLTERDFTNLVLVDLDS